jgi:predicted branched-subunit amino acid permease
MSSHFFSGVKRSIPIAISVAPFGVLFGALAVENGFSMVEALLFSGLLFAGASQMVGIELFGQQVAPWLIVVSIFAVNFRHVLYSAALAQHLKQFPPLQKWFAYFFLTDPQYADTELAARKGQLTFSGYMGLASTVYILWVIETGIGAWFGQLISAYYSIGIDFFLPIYFLGLVMSFRGRNNWVPVIIASGIASSVALFVVGSPWHVSIGAIAGVAVAAIIYKPVSGSIS